MLKPLLNAKPVSKVVKCRTSKSDELCRNLLFSIAWKIGPRTMEMVQTLHHGEISEIDCMVLDEIITLEVYSNQEIEEAADLALQDTRNLFGSFQLALFWGN